MSVIPKSSHDGEEFPQTDQQGASPHGSSFHTEVGRRPLVHPHACAPRRPPRWVRRAPRRDAPTDRRSVREGWHNPRLLTDPRGGPVRINMTYRNSFATSADFSPTIGADVYAEGPFEGIYRSILTTDYETAEFQFQICTIHWTTKEGEDRRYTLDGGRITAAGREIWFEIKADGSYFHDPDIADVLDQAERELARYDIELDRVDGSKLLDRVKLRIINSIIRHRNVPFGTNDVINAHAAIDRHGGIAPFGAVAEKLHASRRQAEAMMSAMLIRRAIGFLVVRPVTPDTPVTLFIRPSRRLTRMPD
jgi:hypothetical protein